MGHRSIDIMLSRPGIYVVSTRCTVVFVEVEGGICYQLTRDGYQRDGELRRGGWAINTIVSIDGPFARVKAETA